MLPLMKSNIIEEQWSVAKQQQRKVSPKIWNVSCSDCFLNGREGVALSKSQRKLARLQPLSQELPLYLHLQWYLSCSLVSMKLELILCHQVNLFLMAGVLAFLKMKHLLAVWWSQWQRVLEEMAGRRLSYFYQNERCLGQDRPRQHHLRSWKVCQSLTSWRSLGMPLLVASLGEDPQGVSWRRVALSLSEAAKAGLRQHLLLID